MTDSRFTNSSFWFQARMGGDIQTSQQRWLPVTPLPKASALCGMGPKQRGRTDFRGKLFGFLHPGCLGRVEPKSLPNQLDRVDQTRGRYSWGARLDLWRYYKRHRTAFPVLVTVKIYLIFQIMLFSGKIVHALCAQIGLTAPPKLPFLWHDCLNVLRPITPRSFI